MTDAVQPDTEDNEAVQYLKAQVDATMEEITVRNSLCVVEKCLSKYILE